MACGGLGRVAWGHFAALVGVEMGECGGAVAVGGDGLVVDVVYYALNVVSFFVSLKMYFLWHKISTDGCFGRCDHQEYVQKGPRLASGKPKRFTTKFTPVPLLLLVPET